jgi:predicted methyltransferase MtxX (methanogen marker protein 4)
MVDVVVKTNRIPRSELQAISGGNVRLLRMLESLQQDIVVTLPDAIGQSQVDVTTLQAQVAAQQALIDQLQGMVFAAMRLSSDIQKLRQQLEEVQALTMAGRSVWH